MPAATSAFALVDPSNLILIYHLDRPGGRGVPDIAVQSMQYALVFRGKTMMMSGTGCSTNVRLSSLYTSMLISD